MNLKSTIMGSTFYCHSCADAILDRLMHNAHRIKLKGESMRKNQSIVDWSWTLEVKRYQAQCVEKRVFTISQNRCSRSSEYAAKEVTLIQGQAAGIRLVTPRRLRQMEYEKNPPPRRNDGKYPAFEFGQWIEDPKSRIAENYIWEQAYEKRNKK